MAPAIFFSRAARSSGVAVNREWVDFAGKIYENFGQPGNESATHLAIQVHSHLPRAQMCLEV